MSTIIGSALKNDSQNEVVCPPEVPGCSLLCGTNGVWWTEYQAPSWAPLSIILWPTLILDVDNRISSQQPASFSIFVRTELTGYILLFSCSMGAFVCPAFFRVCFIVKGPPVIALWWKIILSAESPVIRGAG